MLSAELYKITIVFHLSTTDKFNVVNLHSWCGRTPREQGVYTVITDCWHWYDKLGVDGSHHVTVSQNRSVISVTTLNLLVSMARRMRPTQQNRVCHRRWRREGKGKEGEGEEGEEWKGDSFGLRSGPPTFLRIYAHARNVRKKEKKRW